MSDKRTFVVVIDDGGDRLRTITVDADAVMMPTGGLYESKDFVRFVSAAVHVPGRDIAHPLVLAVRAAHVVSIRDAAGVVSIRDARAGLGGDPAGSSRDANGS